jgi:hypothetical protein
MNLKKIPGLGVNVPANNFSSSQIEKLVRRMNELGNEWIRLEFDFYSPDSLTKHDLLIDLCRKNNIRILGLLTGSVPGNLANLFFPGRKFIPVTAAFGRYQHYVQKTVGRYKGAISRWEVWNEENSLRFWIDKPNPSHYASLLQETYNQIKNIDSRSEVVFGGIMGDDRRKLAPFQVTEFVRKCLEERKNLSFDYLNFHPYLMDCYFSWKNMSWYKQEMRRKIEGIVSYSQSLSSRKILFTEFGISTKWVRLSSQEIAEIYKYIYALSQKNNIDIYFWALFDSPVHSYEIGTPENGFGLLDANLDPKPVFNSLKFLG